MKDLEGILREKLADAGMPLPEGDWERFESGRLLPMIRRRRVVRWSAGFAGLAAAACVAFFALRPSADPVVEPFVSPQPVPPVAAAPEKEADSVQDEILDVVLPPAKSKVRNLVSQANPSPVTEVVEEGQEAEERPEVVENEAVVTHEEKTQKEADTSGNIFIDYETQERSARRTISVSPLLRGAGGRTTTPGAGNTASTGSNLAGQSNFSSNQYLERMDATHSIPVSVGLDVSVGLWPRVSVTSGVELSLYHSKFSDDSQSLVQNACYLGIPLRVDWTIWRDGPVSAWVGAGGKVDRLVYGRIGSEKLTDSTLNWSLTGDLGLRYDLTRNMGLFLAPEVSYFFKPENPAILTYRTENPIVFAVAAGLRFNL